MAVPQPDEAELAERAARRVEREALAEAKAAKAREARSGKAAGLADEKKKGRGQSVKSKERPIPPKRTEAEQKAARDAR